MAVVRRRSPTSRIPVRRNRMAADLEEALDGAVSYAEEAARYADDNGMMNTGTYIEAALMSLGEAIMAMHEEAEAE